MLVLVLVLVLVLALVFAFALVPGEKDVIGVRSTPVPWKSDAALKAFEDDIAKEEAVSAAVLFSQSWATLNKAQQRCLGRCWGFPSLSRLHHSPSFSKPHLSPSFIRLRQSPFLTLSLNRKTLYQDKGFQIPS